MAHTILIIVSDLSVRAAVAEALEADGYRTLQAFGAEEGLALAQAEHPAAVILDEGEWVIAAAGQNPVWRTNADVADIPILLLVDDDRAQSAADAVLQKPFGLRALFETIEALIGRGGTSRTQRNRTC